MQPQNVHPRHAHGLSRRDLLKAGLVAGAALCTWSPYRAPTLDRLLAAVYEELRPQLDRRLRQSPGGVVAGAVGAQWERGEKMGGGRGNGLRIPIP